MPLNPGNDTVTFHLTSWTGPADRLGITGPVKASQDQTGCFMQPVSVSDHINDTQYSAATWKCISPASTLTQQVKAEDSLTFEGVNYRILGSKSYKDFWGRLDHITFMCREENG
jgi:hypothetical protein